jgi:aldehyde dehydrogenase (NAD+)
MVEIESVDQAIEFINHREKPLALYLFASERDAKRVIAQTSSGGACVNDVIMHIANEYLPFGGVGNSGMGRYHGRDSLYAFSHRRSVLATSTKIDLPFRYMPYKWFRYIKRLL